MKLRKRVINLTYDSLIAMLQGKEIHLVDAFEEVEYVFIPPFDGMFLTHTEIGHIKYESQMGILEFFTKVAEHQEKANVQEDES